MEKRYLLDIIWRGAAHICCGSGTADDPYLLRNFMML
jgi:hypothetical protein